MGREAEEGDGDSGTRRPGSANPPDLHLRPGPRLPFRADFPPADLAEDEPGGSRRDA